MFLHWNYTREQVQEKPFFCVLFLYKKDVRTYSYANSHFYNFCKIFNTSKFYKEPLGYYKEDHFEFAW